MNQMIHGRGINNNNGGQGRCNTNRNGHVCQIYGKHVESQGHLVSKCWYRFDTTY